MNLVPTIVHASYLAAIVLHEDVVRRIETWVAGDWPMHIRGNRAYQGCREYIIASQKSPATIFSATGRRVFKPQPGYGGFDQHQSFRPSAGIRSLNRPRIRNISDVRRRGEIRIRTARHSSRPFLTNNISTRSAVPSRLTDTCTDNNQRRR